MPTPQLNWAKLKIDVAEAAEGFPPEDSEHVKRLLSAIGLRDMAALLNELPRFVYAVSKSRSMEMRESAKIFRTIDPDHLATTSRFDTDSPGMVYRESIADEKMRERVRIWAEKLSETLPEIHRETMLLREWKVPDYAGALADLAKQLQAVGMFHLLPDTLVSLVDQVRNGRVSMSVMPLPPVVSMHLPLRAEAYPAVLGESDALEYLKDIHKVSISSGTLKQRAKEPENFSIRSKGAGYSRAGLDDAVARGVFASRNKGRPRGPAN
jgi:hypothetical protein